MSKFFKGALLGAGIGAGLTWLTVTKKGRAVRDEMLDHAAVVYEQVKDKLLESDA
jgi:gas vesicle protein